MATSASTLQTTPTIEPRRQFSDRTQEALSGFGFVAPALLIVVVFIFIPMLAALFVSFREWTGLQPLEESTYVGLSNYQRLLFEAGPTREEFFKALKNTFYYTLGVVPIQTVTSLLLAMIVNQRFLKGRGFFRTAFYFPSITASVVIAMIFLWLFNTNGLINLGIGGLVNLFGGDYAPITWLEDSKGVFHNIYGAFGLTLRTAPEWMRTQILGQSVWSWLSGPSVTMMAIMLLSIWTTSGTLMLIFLAALQDIPTPLYEAASVDGATPRQQFFKITLPMLRPTTFFVITIGLIGCFQVFDQIFVISQGNPAGTTSTIAWIAYRNGFRDSAAGLGAATAFVLFVIVALLTIVQRRFFSGKAD